MADGAMVIEEVPARRVARPAGTTGMVMDPLATDPRGLDVVVPPPPPVPRRRKRPILLGVLLVLLLVGAAVGVPWFVHAAGVESTDDAEVEGHVVAISPQVSARVLKVNVDDNTAVRKGDVVVELDPTDYRVAVDQSTATAEAMAGKLAQARQEIESARATRDEAAAEVGVAEANEKNVRADLQRYTDLSGRTPGAVSKQTFEAAAAAEESNKAQVAQAKAKLAQAESDIATKQATAKAAAGDVAKATADIHRAEVNLTYCTIRAPEDGKVTRKNVEVGAYVQGGEQLFSLVPPKMWVVANYKETQLNRMRVGQSVTIEVDAYPGMTLHGHVDSVQSGTGSRFSILPAENATGNFVKVVQRVPVKILVDGDGTGDPNRPLVPGMSVEPEVELK